MLPEKLKSLPHWIEALVATVGMTLLLTDAWMPLGGGHGYVDNLLFVAIAVGSLMIVFLLFLQVYPRLLRWTLTHKAAFLVLPLSLLLFGATAWQGFDVMFGWLPDSARQNRVIGGVADAFPGLGREFMPAFDEGAFLYMPTTMPHASYGESMALLKDLDAAIQMIPEVDRVVGKIGRVESPLDPAPVSMVETVVTYKSEYAVLEDGTRVRQWRDHIRGPADIWDEITKAAAMPGLTSAPALMPIQTRIIMLQTGMRAPLGLKVRGPDLATIEAAGFLLEEELRKVPAVKPSTVFAERIVGKPYLEIDLDREAIARYGLSIEDVQQVIQIGIGGMTLTRTVEGRERYPVRVRYMREERDSVEALRKTVVQTRDGTAVPLSELSTLRYVRGPQVIKAEDTFLTGYVIFDRQPDIAETDAVEQAQAYLSDRIASGKLVLPDGVSYSFTGTYENQVRSEERLALLVPLALALIFVLLYLQFRRVETSLIIYSGVAVAVSGGFILLWLYNQSWFMDFTMFDTNARELFQVAPVNLSVAVWVGFIALVGIATDDGVVMATYLKQRFKAEPPKNPTEIRARVLEAGMRRVRPCLMTTATTLLALLPVITSQGRGADVMVPMALPSLGGMAVELITLFVVPVLYCASEEGRWHWRRLAARLARAQAAREKQGQRSRL